MNPPTLLSRPIIILAATLGLTGCVRGPKHPLPPRSAPLAETDEFKPPSDLWSAIPPEVLEQIPENQRTPERLRQTLAKKATSVAFPIRGFRFCHVWGGTNGYPATSVPPYRALVAIWSHGPALVAELYFHDSLHDPDRKWPENPNPSESTNKPPYQLHFPMSTLDPVMSELRSPDTDNPVYLVYYSPAGEKQWAIAPLKEESQKAYKP